MLHNTVSEMCPVTVWDQPGPVLFFIDGGSFIAHRSCGGSAHSDNRPMISNIPFLTCGNIIPCYLMV